MAIQKSFFIQAIAIGIVVAILVVIIIMTVGIDIFSRANPLSGSTTQEKDPIRIGIIQYAPVSSLLTDGFKKGMEDIGYIEGENVEYIERAPTLDNDVLAENAQYIVDQGVDAVFATTTVGGFAIANATADIPIVWTHAAGAVNRGLAATYKSSENNTTGIEVSFPELTRKKFEFLTRIDPTIQTIGILEPAVTDFATMFTLPVVLEETDRYGIEMKKYPFLSEVDTAAKEEMDAIMNSIESGDIDAYIYIPSPAIAGESLEAQIAMTKRLNIPSFWLTQDEVLKGGLFTYEYDNIAMGEQSAVQMNKVLQGIAPTDIPIETPAKTLFIMNFDTVEDIGITIPQDILQLVNVRIEE
jgi:putative tryptophan/tyrosine transport system substrate-binding protein